VTKSGEPRVFTDRQVQTLLDLIRERGGLTFTLSEAFSGGEGAGAYALASAKGPAVLKVVAETAAVERFAAVGRALDRLRLRGYPAPAYLATGVFAGGSYVVLQRLPGRPLSTVQPTQVAELIRLNELQADFDAELPDAWPDAVVAPVLEGGPGFCLLETMRAHSVQTRELLQTVQLLASRNAKRTRRARDVVHLDFAPANILSRDGSITGVIDWEAARIGDRGFDLVTLLFYLFDDEPARKALWPLVMDVSGPAAARVYFAHIIHRQVEWSIRFHGDDAVQRYLARGRRILDELARL
jgi:Ser/Thr protein kinase RdoA (MazF antagonist)